MSAAAIILAAGRSRRLGRPKQTLPFGSTTLLGQVVAGAVASPLAPLVLVLGPGMRDSAAQFGRPGLTIVHTAEPAQACSVSIRTGLFPLGNPSAVMLLLGDQPGVTPALIARVLAGWQQAGTPITVASYRGAYGHPFLFSGPALAALRSVSGEKAVWGLVQANPQWVQPVPFDRDLPRDVDTWDDYIALLREHGQPLPAARGGGGEGGAP